MTPKNFKLETISIDDTGLALPSFLALLADAKNLFDKAPALSAIGLYATVDDYDDEVYHKVEGALTYAVDGLGFSESHGQAIAASDAFAAQALYLAEKSWIEVAAGMISLDDQENYDEEFIGSRFILLTRNGRPFFSTDPGALLTDPAQIKHAIRRDNPWHFLQAITTDQSTTGNQLADYQALKDALPHLTNCIDKI